MPGNYDGSIHFDTSIDEGGFLKGVDELKQSLKKLGVQVEELAEITEDMPFSADTSAAQQAISALGETVKALPESVNVQANTADAEQSISGMRHAAEALPDTEEITVTADVQPVDTAAQKVQKTLDSTANQAQTVSTKIGGAFKHISDNIAGSVQRNTGSLRSEMDALKSQLMSLAKTVTVAFSIRSVVSFGKETVEAAAEINAASSAMAQTFGNLAGSAQGAISRISEESGILPTRLNGAAASVFAFAKSAGMESGQALSMMEDALKVAADSAAYYDRSLEGTSETLKSFLKGNYANDAALGISCTETTRNAAANKLYGKTFQQLSEAQKQLALLQMVKDANRLSGAEGQAAREAEGWENVIGNLKEAWRQFLAVIGQPVLRVVSAVVKQLTAAITTLTSAAEKAVVSLGAVFGWEAAQAGSVTGKIADSVREQNALTEAVEETAEAQKELTGIDEIHVLSSKAEQTAAEPAEQPVELAPVIDASETTETATELSEQITLLMQPIRLAWDANAPALKSEMEYALGSVRGLIGQIGMSLETVWTNGSGKRFVGNILQLFGDLFGMIGDISAALESAWSSGKGTEYVQSIVDRWNAALELMHSVSDAFRTAWNDGSGEIIFGNILTILTNINETAAAIRENFRYAWEENDTGVKIFDGIFQIAETVSSVIARITGSTRKWALELDFSPIMESVDGLLDSINPLIDYITDGLADTYEDVLLPLGTWTIEEAAPAAINLLSSAIDAVSAVIKTLKPLGKWLWDTFLKKLAGWTGGVIVKVLNNIADGLKRFSDWIKEHQTLVENIAIVIGSFAAAVGLVVGALAVFSGICGLATTLTTALGAAFAFLASPIGLVILAIGAVIAIGVLLVKHWDEVKAFVIGVWEEIKANFAEVADWFKGLFTKAKNAILKAWDSVVDFFTDIWNAIKTVFSVVKNWFSKIFTNAYQAITKAFRNVGNWFGDRWTDIKRVFSTVSEWFGRIFTGACEAVHNTFSTIGTWFTDRWNDIRNVFAGVSDWFSQTFRKAYTGVTDAFSGVKRFFQNIWEDITSVFGSVKVWFRDRFRDAWDAVKDVFAGASGFFDGVWDGITQGLKDGINWAIEKIDGLLWRLEDGINSIIDALNSMLSIHVPDSVPFVGGTDFSLNLPHVLIPQIPYLATGTVVPANYGEFLAVLGDNRREPEIVAPESAIRKVVAEELAASKNTGGNIVVKLECDGKTLATVIQKYNIRNGRVVNGG